MFLHLHRPGTFRDASGMVLEGVSHMRQIVEKPRGDLEKVLPREDLKPRDVPKANPRAQPEGLPSEYPEAFRFS